MAGGKELVQPINAPTETFNPSFPQSNQSPPPKPNQRNTNPTKNAPRRREAARAHGPRAIEADQGVVPLIEVGHVLAGLRVAEHEPPVVVAAAAARVEGERLFLLMRLLLVVDLVVARVDLRPVDAPAGGRVVGRVGGAVVVCVCG